MKFEKLKTKFQFLACHGDISAVVDANSEIEEKVKVKLCTAADTTYLGSIWEINFSTSNMVIWVIKFSREGHEIRLIFGQKSTHS